MRGEGRERKESEGMKGEKEIVKNLSKKSNENWGATIRRKSARGRGGGGRERAREKGGEKREKEREREGMRR